MSQPTDEFRAMGRDVKIWPMAKIVNKGAISLGNRIIIDDYVLMIGGADTQIGDFVHIAAFSSIVGGGVLILEDFAGISGGVRIYTGNEQYGGECLTNPTVPAPFRLAVRGKVVIRKHAIIGANSVILPGVEIGEGAVVGACSLVRKNCRPWSVYFGAPAKMIGRRPAEEILRQEQTLRQEYYDRTGQYRGGA